MWHIINRGIFSYRANKGPTNSTFATLSQNSRRPVRFFKKMSDPDGSVAIVHTNRSCANLSQRECLIKCESAIRDPSTLWICAVDLDYLRRRGTFHGFCSALIFRIICVNLFFQFKGWSPSILEGTSWIMLNMEKMDEHGWKWQTKTGHTSMENGWTWYDMKYESSLRIVGRTLHQKWSHESYIHLHDFHGTILEIFA